MFTLILTAGLRRLFVPAVYFAATISWSPLFAQESATARTVAATKPALKCSACQCAIESGTICKECALTTAAARSTKPAAMQKTGNVYTLDNDPTNNALAVYTRVSNGSLMPVAGSPFPLKGRGLSGGDIDEQGAIRVHGEFVLAVNPGSDTIAVLRKTGAGLMHVPGSPFASGGSTPLSLTVHGDMVYVANQAAPFAGPKTKPNISGFRMMADGKLVAVPNSRVEFPAGQGPAQVEFSPNGKTLVATAGFQADDASRLYAFKVERDGRVTMGKGSPIMPQGATGTVGFSWSKSGNRVYASLFKGSAVIAFDVEPMTASIRQSSKPVGDDQQAACWTAISRDGQTLYVGNFVSNSVSVYDISGKQPALLGSVPRRGTSGKDTKDIELSADGKYLYAVGSGLRQISVFRVESNRLLTELPPGQSPLMVASGQNITGLAVD